jgi:hypothetical protein
MGTFNNFSFGEPTTCIPITAATITGASIVGCNESFTLTATPTPANATAPTYAWSETGLVSGQGTATAVYNFGTAYADGTAETITCTLDNACTTGTIAGTKSVTVYDFAARGDVCAIVDGVADAGAVYCYKRWFGVRSQAIAMFGYELTTSKELRGFDMELASIEEEQAEFITGDVGAGILRKLNFRLFGYFAWSDAEVSEMRAGAIVKAVCLALDNSETLHGGQTYFDTTRAQCTAIEPWMLGGELVHRATIALTVTEFLTT